MSRDEILTSLRNSLLWAQRYLATMVFREPVHPVVMTPIQNFGKFIESYEGANPANNNPGDFRFYFGGYLPKYGLVKESQGGFAIFETYDLGWEYMINSITQMVNNHSQWDFFDFFSVYAPWKDHNDPVKYAKAGAAWMKVEPTANLKGTLNL